MARPISYPVEQARKILDEGIPYGPRLHPCVCGAGRHAHSGANRTGRCAATRCDRYRVDKAYELAYEAADAQLLSLGQALRKADRLLREQHRAENPVDPGTWRIGASDTGTCRRQIWYRNKHPELGTAWSDEREAMVGTMIHEGAEKRLGLIYPWRLYEFWVTIPGLDRRSRIDWYDPVTCEVGDTKTAGRYRWDRYNDDGPTKATWEQVLLYGLALEDAGYPVHTIRIDVLHREKGHDQPHVRPYDRKEAEAARDYLLGLATGLDLDLDPDDAFPRDGDGVDRDEICRRCPFRNDCWNIPAAEQARRSPYSYTLLGPSPEEESVIWAIEQHVDAKAAENAAKARVAEVKDLLNGIEPRRYGPYQGSVSGGSNGPDWAEYAERLKSYYDLPEAMRPPLDAIDPPRDRRYTYVRWGKVPKSVLAKEARAAKAQAIGEPITKTDDEGVA